MSPVVCARSTFWLALALFGTACAQNTSSAGSVVGGSSGSGTGATTGTGGASVGSGGTTGVGDAGTDGVVGTDGSVGTGGTSAGSGGAGAGTGGSSGSAGAGGGTAGCFVSITPVSPPSFGGLESGPDVKLRVMATVRNPGPRATPIWTWKVVFGGDLTLPITITTIGSDPKVVEFPIARPGSYDITARVDTGVVCTPAEQIPVVNLPSPSLLFRVTPPPSAGFAIPPQDIKVVFNGATPSTTVLNLAGGTSYSVAPQEDQGLTFVPSYVRISGLTSGVVIEGYTAGGPVRAFLLPSTVYDVLVIPDGQIAPTLFSATLPVSGAPLVLDPGIPVSGTTLDGSGAPLSGVRVVLRDGVRPSTVGVTDISGRFSLLSRAGGAQSAVMMPPPTSGLPEAHVSASPGIALGSNLDLKMTWAPVTQAPLALSIENSDGSGPVAGAAVRVESEAELPSVGTLEAQLNSLAVTGSVHVDVIADDAGVARFPHLPVGNYVVTAVQPVSSTAPGMVLTTTSIHLTASGYTGNLPLVRPVKLSGTLLPANIAQGARVTAYDKSAGIATDTVSTIVGAGGAYTLLVAPGLSGRARQYQLVADPPAGAHLARTVLGTVDVSAGDAAAGSLALGPGVSFVGSVRSAAGKMGGAYVQVFCSGSSAACLDPKTPVAETVTQQDGSFSVVVPVPATGP